jgi:UPF0271 protein
MTRFIDLNADAGESPDSASDLPFLEVVTSVNIACGVHAGGPLAISRLSEAARARGVGVGAHPGLASGRETRVVGAQEAKDAVTAQVEEFRRHVQGPVQHVKLHGALYHAARMPKVAAAVVEAVRALAVPLLVAQAGSELERAARAAKVGVVPEAFLDRGYAPDGTLVLRGSPGALLDTESAAAKRAVQVALERRVFATDGRELAVEAATLCVHTDSPGALGMARAAREALERAGVVVRPMGAA